MPQLIVADSEQGKRLDVFLSSVLELSRAQVKEMIREGLVFLNAERVKASEKVSFEDKVDYTLLKKKSYEFISAEDIALDIIYEDDSVLIINKTAEIVMHPAPGNRTGTLSQAVLHHLGKATSQDLRLGIVHRLDKGTSGLVVVAKTEVAKLNLQQQFKNRSIRKCYHAFIWGQMKVAKGIIDAPLIRNPKDRKKYSVASGMQIAKAREAITTFKVKKDFGAISYLELSPKTGRTHQLRVHLKHQQRPIVADPVYAPKVEKHLNLSVDIIKYIQSLEFQLLHAYSIEFKHPETGEQCFFSAPMRADMQKLYDLLNSDL